MKRERKKGFILKNKRERIAKCAPPGKYID